MGYTPLLLPPLCNTGEQVLMNHKNTRRALKTHELSFSGTSSGSQELSENV